MVDRVAELSANRPVVHSDGQMNQEMRRWVQVITQRALILGEGSPEGKVSARLGAEYADTNAATGSIKYIKLQDFVEDPPGNPDYTKGWVLV